MISSYNHIGKILHRGHQACLKFLFFTDYATALWAVHLLGGVVRYFPFIGCHTLIDPLQVAPTLSALWENFTGSSN